MVRGHSVKGGRGGKGLTVAWILLTPLLLLALYVLSVGPVILAVNRGRGQAWVVWSVVGLDRIYGPVKWLHDETPLKRPLGRYVEWWYAAAEGRR
uniref:Uncharacterized protein n=1 Tax=uncultured Armatimonadetes bacterium TaxID=157466 RepID=A0A6J4HQL9_9BACT|nr:hypothetical protein AVDCRST_MAG63-883 [uncultured Armatimonadetes bacterium]